MGLGGGFSGQGEICGHVSAGVIAIGLDVLSMSAEEGRDTVLMRAKIQGETRRFCEAFKKEFGGISCRELVGVDNLTDRKLAEDAFKKGGFKRCFDSQRWVAMYPLYSEQDPEHIPSLDELRSVLSGDASMEEILSGTSARL